ncbi:MAG TPA: hypothetical protein VFP42_09055 [Acidimicrobiia bacterium]|nr:hypothetical protein [Acidimicrobiia bacterium]
MSFPSRHAVGLGMVAIGSAMLISPIRRHRAVWHVTVCDTPARRRVLHGGEYLRAAGVLLSALRSGDRRPDAAFRSALGLAMIGSGLGLSLTQDAS